MAYNGSVTRRLFAILSAVSLLLSVAIVVLWVSSYLGFHSFVWSGPDERFAIQFARGRFWVWQETDLRDGAAFASQPPFQQHVLRPPLPLHLYRRVETRPENWLGFDAWFGTLPGGIIRWREVVVPFWFPVLVSILMPVRWFALRRRDEGRRRRQLCPDCGYDLRATPDRCPECGALPDKALA